MEDLSSGLGDRCRYPACTITEYSGLNGNEILGSAVMIGALGLLVICYRSFKTDRYKTALFTIHKTNQPVRFWLLTLFYLIVVITVLFLGITTLTWSAS